VDGQMRSADMVARGGAGRESYAYTGGRITRVEVEHSGGPGFVLQAEHDGRGLVRIVEAGGPRGPRGPSTVRYERPPNGFDLRAACRAVEVTLDALVLDAVARLALDGPAACVALSYPQGDPLAFLVHVATVDALAAIDADAMWSPEEIETNTHVDFGDAAAAVRLLRQELALLDADDHEASAGSELGRRLLCAVAARLNARDWTDTLPVADDFVVRDGSRSGGPRSESGRLPAARTARTAGQAVSSGQVERHRTPGRRSVARSPRRA